MARPTTRHNMRTLRVMRCTIGVATLWQLSAAQAALAAPDFVALQQLALPAEAVLGGVRGPVRLAAVRSGLATA